MKPSDKQKIKNALLEISKFKWQEEKDGGNDFKRGMASVAEIMLEILATHGNSMEYQTAVNDIVRRSKSNFTNSQGLAM